MHLQNGFILPSTPKGQTPSIFQHSFHQDFPRVLNGYVASINIMFALDQFSTETGATLVVPGTHQRTAAPDQKYLTKNAIPVECPAGSMFVFDSTLWHAAGTEYLGSKIAWRLTINSPVRTLSNKSIMSGRWGRSVLAQPPRTQQLLGLVHASGYKS